MAPAQLRALGRIAKVRAASELYLVGGCALAFHFNHRSSTDLDLFSLRNRIPFEPFKRLARTESSIRLISESDATYFEDADRDPRWPKGLTARHWSQIKRSIARQAIEFVRTPG